jgi:hypothetical protein
LGYSRFSGNNKGIYEYGIFCGGVKEGLIGIGMWNWLGWWINGRCSLGINGNG